MIKNLRQGWRVEKLGNISTLVGGGTPNRSNNEYWENGDIPWLSPTDLKEIGQITEIDNSKDKINSLGLRQSSAKILPVGTVLYSSRATIGKIAINTIEVSTNQGFTNFICNQNLLNKYLAVCLNYYRENILLLSNSTTFKEISKSSFKEFEIPLPPFPQQEKIVKVLDNSSSLVKQQKQLIEKYDVFLKSKFIEMFGDPITNPMGWKKTTCIHVADCIVPGRNKPKSFSGTYMPWITTGDLVDKKAINHSNSNLILSKEEIKEVRAKIIPENSIIFTCVGDLGIVSITKKPIVINQQLHSFQCKEDVVNNYFLMFNISMQKQYMYKMATSTTVPYMNKTTCNNIPTILPPIELQNKFASIVEKIEAIKEKETQKLNHLETLHVSLMDKAFKGEIV